MLFFCFEQLQWYLLPSAILQKKRGLTKLNLLHFSVYYSQLYFKVKLRTQIGTKWVLKHDQKIMPHNRGKIKSDSWLIVTSINLYLGASYQANQIYITVFCQMQVLHHNLSRQPVWIFTRQTESQHLVFWSVDSNLFWCVVTIWNSSVLCTMVPISPTILFSTARCYRFSKGRGQSFALL